MDLVERVARLTERCQDGDDDALVEIIHSTKRALVRRAHMPALHSVDDTEGILQEVYLKFWAQCRAIHTPLALAWLIAAARNLTIDEQRKKFSQKRNGYVLSLEAWTLNADGSNFAASLIDGAANVENIVLARERNHAIQAAAHRLPVAYRDAVYGHAWGETVVEGARRMGIPEGTVKSRRSYAFFRLRRMLEPMREAL